MELDIFSQVLLLMGLPTPEKEYRFHVKRRWRVDFGFPDYKLAVEIEGGAWVYGRHNRPGGFLGDITKYNALAVEGWCLLRFTPRQIKTGEAYATIKEWFEKREAEKSDRRYAHDAF